MQRIDQLRQTDPESPLLDFPDVGSADYIAAFWQEAGQCSPSAFGAAPLSYLEIKQDGITLARSELDKLGSVAGKSQSKLTTLGKANRSVDRLSRSFQGLGAALSALGIGAAATQIVRATDRMASMRGQIGLVTNSQQSLNDVYRRSLELSQQTSVGLQTTVTLYTRLARSTGELGLSQDELFGITQSLNQAFIVSGASAEESQRAMVQFSQALAGGVLRAEEFNSINEQTPYVLDQIAKGMDVTRGELRRMVVDGEVTSEAMLAALQKMAGAIEEDFGKMPDTVGRAMTRVRNDLLDTFGNVETGPLMEAMSEFEELVGDPGFKRSMQELASAILSVAGATAGVMGGLTDFAKFLGEEMAARINGIAGDDIVRLEQKLEDVEKKTTGWRGTLNKINGTFDAFEAKAATLRSRIDAARAAQEEAAAAAVLQTEATDDAADSVDRLDKAQRDAVDSGQKLAAVGLDTSDGMLNLAEAAGMVETKSEGATEKLQATRKELEGPFDQALQNVVERIDTAFSDAWVGAFDSFSDFADGIKDALRRLMGELAHIAITRPIVMSIGAAFGLGSAGAAAGGLGGLSNAITSAGGIGNLLSSGVSGMIGSLGGGVTNFLQGGAGLMESLNFAGGAQFFTGLENTLAMAGGGSVGLGSLLTGGAGLLGGIGASALFGGGTGTSIGSAVGSIGGTAASGTLLPMLGAAAGPVGAIAGALLGGGLGSLFGGSRPSHSTGTAVLDLSSGGITSSTGLRGSGASQELQDQATAVVQQLAGFAQLIGGSSGLIDVGVSDRSGFHLNGVKFGEDVDALIIDALDRITHSATNLDPALRHLILSFDGTAEQTTAYAATLVEAEGVLVNSALKLLDQFKGTADQAIAMAGALTTLSVAMNTDAVDAARQSYEATSMTLGERYAAQTASLRTLIADYDGSVASTQNLSGELSKNVQLTYQMATALMEASDAITSITGASADNIRQSIMSEEELRKARKSEINALVEELQTLADPEQIKSTVAEIATLNQQVFDSLGPFGQAAQNLGSAAGRFDSAAARIPSTFSVRVLSTGQPPVPEFADGGHASPGLAIVGEEGPELVRFNQPGYVHNAADTRAILGGNMGQPELQALAVMMSKQLKIWQRVTRDGESLRTTAA